MQRQLAEWITKSLQGPAEPYRIEAVVKLELRGIMRELRSKQESASPGVKIGGKSKVKLPGLGMVEGGGQGGPLLPEINIEGGSRVTESVSRQLETEVTRLTVILFVDPVMPKDRRDLLVRLAGDLAGIDRARGDDVLVEERPAPPPAGTQVAPTIVAATLQAAPKLPSEVIAICLTTLAAAGILAFGLSRKAGTHVGIGGLGAGGGERGEAGAAAGSPAAAAEAEEQKKRRDEIGAFKVLADATPKEVVQVVAEVDPHTALAIVDLFGIGVEGAKHFEATVPAARRLEIGVGLASPKVLTRDQLGQMETVAQQALQRVRNRVPLGGPGRLAEFLTLAPAAVRDEVLQGVAARDQSLAQAARSAMLLFEDLPRLADASVRQVVTGIDPAIIALAVVGAPEVRGAILGAVSKRLRGIIEAEEELTKEKPAVEIEAARRTVEDAMRLLHLRGELRPRAGADAPAAAA